MQIVVVIVYAHFYPRSPCGERPDTLTDDVSTGGISIHALLAESDVETFRQVVSSKLHFYPRSPCGERPIRKRQAVPIIQISIHALLAESDSKSAQNSGALLRI